MLLLLTLCQQKQTPLAIDELMSIVWPGQIVSEASVYQAISQLRKALGDNSKQPEYIQRISNQGYRIIAPIYHSEVGAKHTSTHKQRQIYWLLLLILIVMITSLVYVQLVPKKPDNLVLPEISTLSFAGLSMDTDNSEPRLQALSGIVLAHLAQLPNIKVLQTSETKNSQATLSGNISRQGQELRVSIQIVDSLTGQLLWAKLFDGNENNLFKLQDEINTSIYQAFDVHNSKADKTAIDKTQKSFQQYLLARYHWKQRKPVNLMRALDIYQNMPEPLSPLAATGMCEVYIYLNIYSDWPLENVEQACQPLLKQALGKSPGLGQALAAKALLSSRSVEYPQARQRFLEAISANPNYPFSYLWYAQLLRNQGDYQQALSLSHKAFELAPQSAIINRDLAYSYLNIRDLSQARYYYKRAAELEPDYPHKAITELDFFPATPARIKAFLHWADQFPLMLERHQNYQLTAIQVYLNLGQLDKVNQSITRVNETAASPAFSLYLKASVAVANNDLQTATQRLKQRLEQASDKPKHTYPYIAALYESGQYRQVLALIEQYHPDITSSNPDAITHNKYWLALVYQSKLHLNQAISQNELAQLDSAFSKEKYNIDGLYWMYHRGKTQQAKKLAIELLNQGWLPDYNQDMFAVDKLQTILGDETMLKQMLSKNSAALYH